MPRPARKQFTVIDEREYGAELREIADRMEAPPQALSAAHSVPLIEDAWVQTLSRLVPRTSTGGARAGRFAVAVGQYFVWHVRGQDVPCLARLGHGAIPFYVLFALYWRLLKRNLLLDARTADDLVRLDMAGRGDTELRHALVKLLERNFSPPAPEPLAAVLREWADMLAADEDALFRKLSLRIRALVGDKD